MSRLERKILGISRNVLLLTQKSSIVRMCTLLCADSVGVGQTMINGHNRKRSVSMINNIRNKYETAVHKDKPLTFHHPYIGSINAICQIKSIIASFMILYFVLCSGQEEEVRTVGKSGLLCTWLKDAIETMEIWCPLMYDWLSAV